ncbi:uncharacterized protein [Periplaneta americana]|uniref:uncharacterized protein isoform X1 n=1 Tax=Periplaneta americana TaxID=6978 RepID=UPI0037E82249
MDETEMESERYTFAVHSNDNSCTEEEPLSEQEGNLSDVDMMDIKEEWLDDSFDDTSETAESSHFPVMKCEVEDENFLGWDETAVNEDCVDSTSKVKVEECLERISFPVVKLEPQDETSLGHDETGKNEDCVDHSTDPAPEAIAVQTAVGINSPVVEHEAEIEIHKKGDNSPVKTTLDTTKEKQIAVLRPQVLPLQTKFDSDVHFLPGVDDLDGQKTGNVNNNPTCDVDVADEGNSRKLQDEPFRTDGVLSRSIPVTRKRRCEELCRLKVEFYSKRLKYLETESKIKGRIFEIEKKIREIEFAKLENGLFM